MANNYVFEKGGTSEKGCVEIEDWGTSVPFVLGFQENSICTLHFTLMSYLKDYKMLQILNKNWLLVSKITWRIGKFQTSNGKSKKLKSNGLLLSKKYIPSAKTLYTEDLSNITVIFETKRTKNHTTQLLFIFSGQALHTFYKSSPLKCKFSDFPLLVLKFTTVFP